MSSSCYISHFPAASTPLLTSHYVMYHAQAPNAPTTAVHWVKHPNSQLQLKHTTDIYLYFLNTICKTSTQLPMDPTFHNFCTSPDDSTLCAYNKNRTVEESRTSIMYSSYKYLRIYTFHKDNGPVSSTINNLNKSTSNSPTANSVHLYAHLQCPPVCIIQHSMLQKTHPHSGTP